MISLREFLRKWRDGGSCGACSPAHCGNSSIRPRGTRHLCSADGHTMLVGYVLSRGAACRARTGGGHDAWPGRPLFIGGERQIRRDDADAAASVMGPAVGSAGLSGHAGGWVRAARFSARFYALQLRAAPGEAQRGYGAAARCLWGARLFAHAQRRGRIASRCRAGRTVQAPRWPSMSTDHAGAQVADAGHRFSRRHRLLAAVMG